MKSRAKEVEEGPFLSWSEARQRQLILLPSNVKGKTKCAESYRTLGHMEALRKTVVSLLATIDDEIEEMEVEGVLAPRPHGLASISDEILSRILDFVGASYEWTDYWKTVRKELLRVTQVSRRFRRRAAYAQCIQEYGRFDEEPARDFEIQLGDLETIRIPPKTITKLSLVSNRKISPSVIATALTNMPLLKYLDINLDIISDIPPLRLVHRTRASFDWFESEFSLLSDDFGVVLPQLERLRVSTSRNLSRVSPARHTPLGRLLKGLSMPHLREIQLDGRRLDDDCYEPGLNESFDELFGSGFKSYIGVTRLVLLGLHHGRDRLTLNDLHHAFPDLEELHLIFSKNIFLIDETEFGRIGGDSDEPVTNLAPLKRLRITFNCPPDDTQRPSLLLEEMRKLGAELEEVIIDTLDDSIIQDAQLVFPRAHRVTRNSFCEP